MSGDIKATADEAVAAASRAAWKSSMAEHRAVEAWRASSADAAEELAGAAQAAALAAQAWEAAAWAAWRSEAAAQAEARKDGRDEH